MRVLVSKGINKLMVMNSGEEVCLVTAGSVIGIVVSTNLNNLFGKHSTPIPNRNFEKRVPVGGGHQSKQIGGDRRGMPKQILPTTRSGWVDKNY